jgi:exopolyphosphatase/guanosine-5'-triphosphate,3'-diphosphate pyrophosphatase
LLHRARDDAALPDMGVRSSPRCFELQIDRAWLSAAPLTAAVLDEEVQQWASVGIDFKVRGLRAAT